MTDPVHPNNAYVLHASGNEGWISARNLVLILVVIGRHRYLCGIFISVNPVYIIFTFPSNVLFDKTII